MSDNGLWLNYVRFRFRAEAYDRIDELDIHRLRTNFRDMYDEAVVAAWSDDEIRQEVKNIADYIYPEDMDDFNPEVQGLDIDGKKYLFAGGWTGGQDTPSDEFDMIEYLLSFGMDED